MTNRNRSSWGFGLLALMLLSLGLAGCGGQPETLGEVVLQVALGLCLLQPRAPELEHHEQEHHGAEDRQRPPDGAEDPRQRHSPIVPRPPRRPRRGAGVAGDGAATGADR